MTEKHKQTIKSALIAYKYDAGRRALREEAKVGMDISDADIANALKMLDDDVFYAELKDQDRDSDHDRTVKMTVHSNRGTHLTIAADGYGDLVSFDGAPVIMELYEGTLRVLVWSDINSEDPSHTIDLAGAKESAREEPTKCHTLTQSADASVTAKVN